ncbi:hypothetical protein CRV24_010001 [Beauveria bassiana]|nr:hypothetical protein CRV24_010001 [Beauveria bassiana]
MYYKRSAAQPISKFQFADLTHKACVENTFKMRYLVLLPVVFCSLAQAQDYIAATLYGAEDFEFGVYRDRCTNLRKDQDVNCDDETKRLPAGEHDISSLDFKSIECEGELDATAEEQS